MSTISYTRVPAFGNELLLYYCMPMFLLDFVRFVADWCLVVWEDDGEEWLELLGVEGGNGVGTRRVIFIYYSK